MSVCRYHCILFGDEEEADIVFDDNKLDLARKPHNHVTALKIYVASNDQSLNLHTDEGYVLEIAAPVSALSVWSPDNFLSTPWLGCCIVRIASIDEGEGFFYVPTLPYMNYLNNGDETFRKK